MKRRQRQTQRTYEKIQNHLGSGSCHDLRRSGPGCVAKSIHDEQRRLWHNHVALTREYLLKAAANQPSAQPTLQRLSHNQDDIGNAFKAYYGTATGSELTA